MKVDCPHAGTRTRSLRSLLWDDNGSARTEAAVAAVLFALALFAYFTSQPAGRVAAARPAPLLLFTLLAGGYVSLGVAVVRERLRELLAARWLRVAAGPVVLWTACVLYAAVTGLSVGDRALIFAVYLAVPTLLLASGESTPPSVTLPWRELGAAAFLGLAIKYHFLPSLPVPAPHGWDASRLVGLVAGLYLFLVARPLRGVGYSWSIDAGDLRTAFAAFAAFAVVAAPIGLVTHFLAWHPQPSWSSALLQPIVIYLVTAVPEEFLFRGLIQNLLERWLGPTAGFAIAAILFGLSHLPDPRYAFLATLAGVAYGWVYRRRGKITASAVTHALVDGVWVVLLRA
jgi:membrane protease YdiL (CAAX protease family)